MARAQAAILCNAAQEVNGLVSMLSGFVSRINATELPARAQLWFVVHLEWDEADFNTDAVAITRVEHADGEQLARFEIQSHVDRPDTIDPDVPTGSNLLLPLLLDLRREGVYWVTLTFNGEELVRLPLRVVAQLPTV